MLDQLWNRLAAQVGGWHAARQLRRFSIAVADCRRTQACALRRQLIEGAQSEFGRQHQLGRVHDAAEYRRALPLARYEDFAPYIERVKGGQSDALFAPGTTVRMFALTSGTTDQPKYIPVTDTFAAQYQRGWNIWGMSALCDHRDAWLRQIVQIGSAAREYDTDAGIPCGAISGALVDRQKKIVRKMYVVPPEVFSITDAESRYYTILRLALSRDVSWMTTANPSSLLALARCGDEHSESLISDLHDGTLSPPGPIDPSVRHLIERRLFQEPQAAKRMASIRDLSRGRFLPRDYFNLSFLAHWTGGTLGLYLRDLAEYYGTTPSRDIGLLASEGRVTIPMQDGSSAGVLDVTSHFFEFIPESDDEKDQPATYLAHELVQSGKYFVVMTTAAGLYRYRLGDLVEVVGKEGTTPVLRFLSKGAHTSSLTGEKLTEHQAVVAVRRVAEQKQLPLKEFVMAPAWGSPPFYRLHVEGSDLRALGPEGLAGAVDDELRTINIEYASKRDSGRLGCLRVHRLQRGFFAAYDARKLAQQGGRSAQYKHTYLLTRVGIDEQFAASELR